VHNSAFWFGRKGGDVRNKEVNQRQTISKKTNKIRRKEMNVISVIKRYHRVPGRKAIVAVALFALPLLAVNFGSQAAAAENSPLLNTLIQRGILTQEDADQIQQETTAQEQQKKQEMVKEEQGKGFELPKALQGLKISLQGFAEYSVGKIGGPGNAEDSYNQFNLTRGYLTVQKDVNSWLGGRVTTDIHQVDGSWDTRLKYLYGQLKAGDMGFLTGVKSELGLGHTPWLDFEEHINPYRDQSPMLTDRGGIQSSADIGVGLQGDLGGKLNDAKALVGTSAYDGRYGSWHIGVYNGAGYHDPEKNQNKLAEGRLTVRPLPDALPGLKLSYFGAFGKGNTADEPDFHLNLGMVSFQHPDFILTAQYFASKGSSGGGLVGPGDATKSLDAVGYSFFGAYHLPVLDHKLSVFGRYDHANDDDNHDVAEHADYTMYVGGLSYDLPNGNMIVVDYEKVTYGVNSGGIGKSPSVGKDLGDDHRMQVVYQIQF
jgi:hypothetical protein